MEISTSQFREQCVQLIDKVHNFHTEIIITKHGKPWARLVSIDDSEFQPFIASLTGVGHTVGDLLEPFDDEWECD